MPNATIIQISVSPGGMPKLAVPSAAVTSDGVANDWQRNRKYHGGLDRAICLYSVEWLDWLASEGIDVSPGQLGENFTTRGLDFQSLVPGDRLRAGNCLIELTGIREPCRNINRWHPRLLKTIRGRSGWLARVLEPGIVHQGDNITLMPSIAFDGGSNGRWAAPASVEGASSSPR